MRRIVYHSVSTKPFSRGEIAALVLASANYNAKVDVTGVLVYEDGCFLQVLEGPSVSIDMVMLRIEKDPAHQNIQTVQDQAVGGRLFQNWAMRVCNVREPPSTSAALTDMNALKRSRQRRESEIAMMVDSLAAYYVAENLTGLA